MPPTSGRHLPWNAEICGTTHKTVKRVIGRIEAGQGRVSAKRLLPKAKAAGYAGSDRNFRRLVAQVRLCLRAHDGRVRGSRCRSLDRRGSVSPWWLPSCREGTSSARHSS